MECFKVLYKNVFSDKLSPKMQINTDIFIYKSIASKKGSCFKPVLTLEIYRKILSNILANLSKYINIK